MCLSSITNLLIFWNAMLKIQPFKLLETTGSKEREGNSLICLLQAAFLRVCKHKGLNCVL